MFRLKEYAFNEDILKKIDEGKELKTSFLLITYSTERDEELYSEIETTVGWKEICH